MSEQSSGRSGEVADETSTRWLLGAFGHEAAPRRRRRSRAARAAVIVAVLVAGLLAPSPAGAAPALDPYNDDSGRYSFAERAADLVSRMTLNEKLGQFNAASTRYGGTPAAAIPRLGVRAYHYWNEALHGVARVGVATTFPTGLGIGSTWNPGLVQQATEAMSDEARALWNSSRTDIGLTYWSPTINMARDPRWGRADESYGEDPFHTAKLAGAFVDGLQGDDDTYYQAVATAKHYAANNHENNRHADSSDMSEKTLREFYLPAFQSLAENHDLGSVMTAYNRVNGTPSVANQELITDLLRRSWGFDGFITSDCWAIDDVWMNHKWQPDGFDRPVNATEATAFSLLAGTDLDCQGGQYSTYLLPALDQGLITEDDLDISLTRAFTARFRTGEFDSADKNPWPASRYNIDDTVANAEHAALAETMAEEAIVLLENRAPQGGGDPILPLNAATSQNVVVVGDVADHQYVGDYSPTSPTPEDTVLKGVTDAVITAGGTVTHVGNNDQGTLTPAEDATVAAASTVIVAVGTKAGDQDSGVGGSANPDSGEFRDRTSLTLPRNQQDLVSKVAQLNARVVTYIQAVAQVDVSAFADDVEALLWSTYNGQTQGTSLARILWAAEGTNPSGKLPFTWYGDQSQLPGIKDYEIIPHDGTVGRTYQYFTGTVAYPFGYGLSYSQFDLSSPRIEDSTLTPQGTLEVSVDVTNTSAVAGSTVPQLYVTAPGANGVSRPNSKLVAFDKVAVPAGATTTVELTAAIADLWSWDSEAGVEVIDQGTWTVGVGTDADSAAASQATFEVTGERAKTLQQVTTIPTGIELDTASAHPMIDAGLSAVANDQSFYDLDKVEVVYASSDPAVAVVSSSGKVTPGLKAGVSTITATVTAGGTTKSDAFPVIVERPAPVLSSIAVGGVALENFDPLVTSYTAGVSDPSSLPEVTATSAGLDVAVRQATAADPEATITVTDTAGLARTYAVGFRRNLESISFANKSGAQLATAGWTIRDENSAAWRSVSTGLQIDSAAGDLFQAQSTTPKNLLLRDAPGDWTATVKVSPKAAIDQNYQQGFIGVYGDDDNYVKIGIQRDGTTRVTSLIETGGIASQTSTQEQFTANPTQPVWLRISKSGAQYVTSWSINGDTFQRLRGSATLDVTDPKFMIGAINGETTAAGRTIEFDGVQVAAAPVATSTLVAGTGLPAVSGTSLTGGWSVVRPNWSNLTADASTTTIKIEDGEQWQGQPGGSGPSAGTAKNLLLHDAAGSWSSTVRLDLSQAPATNYEKAVLGVYDDDDNFVLLTYQFDGSRSIEFSVEGDGVRGQRTVTPLEAGGTTLYLRLEKVGDRYTAWFSSDNANWTPASTAPVQFKAVAPKLQLAAYGSGSGRTVSFSELSVRAASDTSTLESIDFRNKDRQSLVDAGWSVIREDGANVAYGGSSGLVIKSTPTSLWGGTNTAKNLVTHRADGDWSATVDLAVSNPSANWQQAVFGVYDNDGDYIKLTRSFDSGAASTQQLQWAVENGGIGQALAAQAFPSTAVLLRIVKTGDNFAAFWSNDGEHYSPLGGTITKSFTDPRLFLTAYNDSTATTQLTATFRSLTVESIVPSAFTRFELPQQTFTLAQATDGAQLVPDIETSTGVLPALTYSLQPSAVNTAGAAVTPSGVLTATKSGQVRVTLQGTIAGDSAGTAALITIRNDVDVSALQARVAGIRSEIDAGALVESGYTASSWAALETALVEAQAIVDFSGRSASDVQGADSALLQARAGLVVRGDTTALAALVASTDEYVEKQFTSSSWSALTEALDLAQALIAASDDAAATEVQAATASLNTAVAGLERTLAITASAATRCVAGKVTLTVTAKNEDAVAVSLSITSAYGSKTVSALGVGKSASQAFTTRQTAIESGSTTVMATATVDGKTVSAPVVLAYPARSCN